MSLYLVALLAVAAPVALAQDCPSLEESGYEYFVGADQHCYRAKEYKPQADQLAEGCDDGEVPVFQNITDLTIASEATGIKFAWTDAAVVPGSNFFKWVSGTVDDLLTPNGDGYITRDATSTLRLKDKEDGEEYCLEFINKVGESPHLGVRKCSTPCPIYCKLVRPCGAGRGYGQQSGTDNCFRASTRNFPLFDPLTNLPLNIDTVCEDDEVPILNDYPELLAASEASGIKYIWTNGAPAVNGEKGFRFNEGTTGDLLKKYPDSTRHLTFKASRDDPDMRCIEFVNRPDEPAFLKKQNCSLPCPILCGRPTIPPRMNI